VEKIITLPLLPYTYNALEPVISRQALKVHYEGHHAAYVSNYNNNIGDKEFNFNGHILHSHFWGSLCPFNGYAEPVGLLNKAIKSEFGSVNNFYQELASAFTSIQGSGWVIIGVDNKGNVGINTIFNHDLRDLSIRPLIAIDAWEHAYYLDYANSKTKFFESLLAIINWEKADAIYSSFV